MTQEEPQGAADQSAETSARRPVWKRPVTWIAAGAALALVIGVGFALQPEEEPVAAPSRPPAASPTPAPSETVEESPENTEVYDLATLPVVDVFALAPGLPLDGAPTADPLAMVATPKAPGAPLFSDPASPPVGVLPSQLRFDGTTVPVLEQESHWAKVMLSGRAGLPSQGVAGQLTAWVRTADVDFTPSELSVRVSLSSPLIQIFDGDTVVYETGETAIGAVGTPTPVGRTFIMTTRVDENAGYTRGFPIVYLGLQSETLDGFNGQNNAITAFHYHDQRQGAISNGCLRVSEESIEQLAALPLGTPVIITE